MTACEPTREPSIGLLVAHLDDCERQVISATIPYWKGLGGEVVDGTTK